MSKVGSRLFPKHISEPKTFTHFVNLRKKCDQAVDGEIYLIPRVPGIYITRSSRGPSIDDSGVANHPRDQLGKYMLHIRDQTSLGSARMSGLSVVTNIDLLSDRQHPPDPTGATVRQVCEVVPKFRAGRR